MRLEMAGLGDGIYQRLALVSRHEYDKIEIYLRDSENILIFRQLSGTDRLAWGLVPARIVGGISSRSVCDTHQLIACGPVFLAVLLAS